MFKNLKNISTIMLLITSTSHVFADYGLYVINNSSMDIDVYVAHKNSGNRNVVYSSNSGPDLNTTRSTTNDGAIVDILYKIHPNPNYNVAILYDQSPVAVVVRFYDGDGSIAQTVSFPIDTNFNNSQLIVEGNNYAVYPAGGQPYANWDKMTNVDKLPDTGWSLSNDAKAANDLRPIANSVASFKGDTHEFQAMFYDDVAERIRKETRPSNK